MMVTNKKAGVPMSKQKQSSYRPTANPEYIQGMREIRSSNKAGGHQDQRLKRARTRDAAKRQAVRDWS